MGKSIREVYGTVLAELGDTNENIVVLDADLSGSTKSGIFAKAHPERHFNMGIAESDMVATAAGLATTGKIPFVNTFTVFLTTLGLISARAQVCYGNLNVKFGGAYCGMSDALDGATHHATEDIAVMRALPNMTVLVPSDATSTRWATKYAVDTYGPMYLRLSRDVYPDLYDENTKFECGKGAIVRDGTDVTVIACGILVHKALEAAEQMVVLVEEFHEVGRLHAHVRVILGVIVEDRQVLNPCSISFQVHIRSSYSIAALRASIASVMLSCAVSRLSAAASMAA
jgi:transketolase